MAGAKLAEIRSLGCNIRVFDYVRMEGERARMEACNRAAMSAVGDSCTLEEWVGHGCA